MARRMKLQSLNSELYKKRVEKIARNEGVVKGAQIAALIALVF